MPPAANDFPLHLPPSRFRSCISSRNRRDDPGGVDSSVGPAGGGSAAAKVAAEWYFQLRPMPVLGDRSAGRSSCAACGRICCMFHGPLAIPTRVARAGSRSCPC